MTNGIAISIIVFLMALNVAIIIKSIFIDLHRNRDRLLIYMTMLSLSMLGWQITYLVFFVTSNPALIRFTFDFKLPFVALASFFIALIVVQFYRHEHLLNRTAVMIMLIVPGFTLIYSLFSPGHDLIRESFSILQIYPIHEVLSQRGIWFWVHTLICYTFMIGAFVVSVYSHRRLPKSYRYPSYVLLIGLFVALLTNVLQIFGITYQAFDNSFVGISIVVIVLYFAVIRSKGVDFIISARNEIYDYLEEGVFVLNDDRYVVYLNRAAKEKTGKLHLKIINQNYDSIFEKAVESTINIEAAPADEDGLDMTFIEDGNEVVFNLREKPIKDNSGVPIGTLTVFDDVTKNRAVINKLENIGGIDALTGLPNRRSIDKFMDSVDKPGKYPLTIIEGDVNGLKQVNDKLGHKQGDLLIRVVSESLSDVCPPKGRVSRIGGDEFLIVIPNSSKEEADRYIEEVKDKMASTRSYSFTPSVSFGYAFKAYKEESLTNVIDTADKLMYDKKKADKAALRKEEKNGI